MIDVSKIDYMDDEFPTFENVEVHYSTTKEGTKVLSFIADPDVSIEKLTLSAISKLMELKTKETKNFGAMFLMADDKRASLIRVGDENRIVALMATSLILPDFKQTQNLAKLLSKVFVVSADVIKERAKNSNKKE